MVNTLVSTGAHTAAASPLPSLSSNAVSTPHLVSVHPLAASGIDPVQLHAQALNALGRITRELLSPATDHELVSSQLARATEALEALRIVDAHFTN